MQIFDTHAHLDQIGNIQQALSDAKAAGVTGVMAVGVDLKANQRNLELKARFEEPKIFVGLGIHPGNIIANEIQETLDFIKANIEKASAIGEIGLDYWYPGVRKDPAKKAEQQDIFRCQCELAQTSGLPVIVHSRGAWKECFDTLRSIGIKHAVFHWYSGPVDVLKEILNAGYYISATPSLAYSPQAREAMAFAPLEQTLIETDSPVYFRGTDGTPGFQAGPKDVVLTLKLYSELKKIDAEKAAVTLNDNAGRILRMEI